MPQAIDEEALKDLKILDVAKPPMKEIPFSHLPTTVYDHKRSRPGKILVRVNQMNGEEIETHVAPKIVSKIVNDQKELDAALKAGWQKKVPVFDAAEPEEIIPEAPKA